jgi:chromosome segregation ATPase
MVHIDLLETIHIVSQQVQNVTDANQHLRNDVHNLKYVIQNLTSQNDQQRIDIQKLTTSNVELHTAVRTLEQKDAMVDRQMTANSDDIRNLTAVVGECV